MLTVKELLFLAEVPAELWPDGAAEFRDACISHLRDKQVFRSLPVEAHEYNDVLWSMPPAERAGLRERFLAEHPELHFKEKAGWLRFGYPLSYNSDVLEALWALMRIGEPPRAEYQSGIDVVREAADKQMRWKLRNSFNGKMLADVETRGQPSKWLTLHALQVLEWARG
jgi:bacterioferritin (cytochrome b1)